MNPSMIHSGQPYWSNNPICTFTIKTGTSYSIGEVIQRDKMSKIYEMLQKKSVDMGEIYWNSK